MAKKLSGIPFIDRLRASSAIRTAKKRVKKVERAVADAREAIGKAKKRAESTDRVSIVNKAADVESNLESFLCPIKRGGSGGAAEDPCDEIKLDCRKKVGASPKGPVAKDKKAAWTDCIQAAGCDE